MIRMILVMGMRMGMVDIRILMDLLIGNRRGGRSRDRLSPQEVKAIHAVGLGNGIQRGQKDRYESCTCYQLYHDGRYGRHSFVYVFRITNISKSFKF